MLEDLSTTELREVEKHQTTMSTECGSEVAFEMAKSDWLANHALFWRKERHARMLELQREEMLKFKWIESQKANKDLGKEVVFEWIDKHAAKWREWYNQNYEEGRVKG